MANQPVKSGDLVELKGVAVAGDRGISQVEVSVDDGKSWRVAKLDYPGMRLSWALWSLGWRPAQPGEYMLVVRATDGNGALQTAKERGSGPEPATGYHKLKVTAIS
ncbi:MAG: hypothetical protein ACR2PL_09170 [Dehalococcoidia bacterium]